jgi:UDP-N-acetylmuramate dehydrogenase
MGRTTTSSRCDNVSDENEVCPLDSRPRSDFTSPLTLATAMSTATLKLSSPLRGLEAITTENASLKPHTWYRIGGPARYLVRPRSIEELRATLHAANDASLPVYVLGLGANLLVRDEGVDGVVIKLDEPAFREVTIEGTLVRAAAGADAANLAGIPGTLGGLIRMNAGGKFGDIGAVVESVDVMDYSGQLTTLTRHEILFSYRSTDIAAPIILGATLRLEADDPEELGKRYKEIWMYKQNSQPLNAKSCGCIFKNPGQAQSAGALIDQAGLKGLRVGNAEVSTRHANFLIAHPDCTSADVLKLIKLVQERVAEKFAIDLHPEVKVWPLEN